MNINLTLIMQMVVFILLIWVTMKFVWPMIMGADGRAARKIAAGLAAAEKGEARTGEPQERSKDIMREARDRAAQIVDRRGKRSNEMVEEAKGTASSEAQRLVAQAHEEVARETTRARESLRAKSARSRSKAPRACWGARSIRKTHAEMLDKLAAEVCRG